MAAEIMGKSGIEVYARDLVTALARLDVDLRMILVSRRRHAMALQELVGPAHDVRPTLHHELMLGPALVRGTHMLLRQRWSRSIRDADLVHLTSHASWRPGFKRAVATIHDLFPLMPDLGASAHLQRTFPYMVEPLLQHAQRIIVPSAYVASTIEQFYPRYAHNVRVVHHGAREAFRPTSMDTETRRRLGVPADTPYMLFVGRVDPRKNISRMLRAWLSLPEGVRSGHAFVLVLSGIPHDIETFRTQEAAALADPSIITVIGPSTPDVIKLYSAARGLAFASLAEGFGLPVIEAMRCGCPVITSSTSSLGEVAGDAALLVEPTSIDDLRSAMERLITDDDLAQDLRHRGMARATMFTFEATARRTYDVYREALGV